MGKTVPGMRAPMVSNPPHRAKAPTNRPSKGAAMTLQTAINILNQAANGHVFTTGKDFYDALRLAILALIEQRDRQEGYRP